MYKLLRLALLVMGASAACFAGSVSVPEIGPASGGAAIALLVGGLVVMRSRRAKK